MITVVIASYKYAHLAANCIESVLCQTVKPQKILVVDDAGGDNVSAVADIYGIECLTREENMGTVANFQDVLMNHVTTPKVMFLGADNWLRDDCLERIINVDADIVSTDLLITGEKRDVFANRVGAKDSLFGYRVWQFQKGEIDRANYIHGSSLYNADLAKSVGGYERGPNQNTEEDWMLWKKMLNAKATHIHVPEPLIYYRRHRNNFIKI